MMTEPYCSMCNRFGHNTEDCRHPKTRESLAQAPGSGKSCCWVKDEYGNKCARAASWITMKNQTYCDHHAVQMRKLSVLLAPLSPNPGYEGD